MGDILRDWSAGDDVSAAHLNEPLNAIRAISSIIGDNGADIAQTPNGTSLTLRHRLPRAGTFPAIITNTDGNKNEQGTPTADYTTNLYFAKPCWIASGNTSDLPVFYPDVPPTSDLKDDGSTTAPKEYPAVITIANLAEGIADGSNGSHLLPIDESRVVRVFGFYDRSDPPVLRYFCEAPVTNIVPVTLVKTGGTGGDGTTQASWVYTAIAGNGVQVGSGLSPESQRPVGPMLFATKGIGYMDRDRVFHLLFTDEVPDTGPCA